MFGYIRPCKPELKLKEYEAFRAVYCGLCHQLGKSFGPFARLTLSYDFTFLAMVHYAQGGHAVQIEKGRCCVNPVQRVPLCKSDEVLRQTADVAALMIYHNLLDNIEDSTGAKRQGYRALKPMVKPAADVAAKRNPAACEAVETLMARQSQVEADPGAGVDAAAEPTAKALATICMQLSSDEVQRRVLERFGYLIGRFIYLCDALEDMEEDRASGGFNPLLPEEPSRRNDPAALEQARLDAKDTLYLTIGETAKTCELLKLEAFGPVIRNIVYLGMPEQVQRILPEREKLNGRSV